ncbi:hypothetical protein SAMN02745157_0207 [Kaistia soli DSM 19436]|uniref:Uncharacterized protein n=1 Tax=Kaistia soli DSM 19436 TaxID=1122133 RepID=A0A1M5PQA3_9HYPH|nr:hypothetical protein [Kaistia soli]SHH03850.1 hypothetical protein SAMN02745157_0207 [Kaistia soli DSM 19436]
MSADAADCARQLWINVIALAIDDATLTAAAQNNKDLVRYQARSWLTKPSADFNEVCHLAGLDPKAVREGAVRCIQAYDANPERAECSYEFEGERHTIAEWSERLGLDRSVLRGRLKSGWPVGEALTAPYGFRAPRKRKRAA